MSIMTLGSKMFPLCGSLALIYIQLKNTKTSSLKLQGPELSEKFLFCFIDGKWESMTPMVGDNLDLMA